MKPTKITLLKKERKVLFAYEENQNLILDASFLRAASPSAENKKHAENPDEKRFININITNIEKVGNYALRFFFDDGHNTGIYSWDYIIQLGQLYSKNSNP